MNLPVPVSTNPDGHGIVVGLPGGPFYLDVACAEAFIAAMTAAVARAKAGRRRPKPGPIPDPQEASLFE